MSVGAGSQVQEPEGQKSLEKGKKREEPYNFAAIVLLIKNFGEKDRKK